jgi:anti-sigma factor RsiW
VDCTETQHLIHAYLDEELDLVRSLEMERHLETCSTCSRVYRQQQALRTALRDPTLVHQLPAGLEERLRSSLKAAGRTSPGPRRSIWPWLAVAASVALIGVLLGWGLWRSRSLPADLQLQELMDSHLRSLMVVQLGNLPVDVKSSNQHVVKPWFNGKVDFAPPVFDGTDQGFPLVGGRLDHVINRDVAVLVYRRQAHWISLFLWPADHDVGEGPWEVTRQGYHLIHWIQAGMTCWAVSDLNSKELLEFVQLFQQQAAPAPAP